jgi:cobaltochelatase CobS
VGYAPAKVEQELLAKAVPYVKGFAPQMVQLANHIRHTFEVGECSVTMSTRNLLRWARLAQDYRRAQCPLKEALRLALLSRTPKHEADSINEQCQMIFGQENWPRD